MKNPTHCPWRNEHESYEQWMALKNAGSFGQTAEHFEKATENPAYALTGRPKWVSASGKM